MEGKQTLKKLGVRFRWNFFGFLLLTTLSSYLSFLIRLNLRANLLSQTTGQFYWILGQFSLTNQLSLLITLSFCFFIRLTIQLALNWGKKYYERLIYIYLIKEAFFWKEKNNNSITLTEWATNFSQQILYFLINFVTLIIDFLLEIYSLYFLITSRNLTSSVGLIKWFTLANITWLLIYHLFLIPLIEKNREKKRNHWREEEIQINLFWENKSSNISTKKIEKWLTLLDTNSSKLFSDFFFVTLAHLPNLIISGTHLLFLFSWYGSRSKVLDWNAYLIALNCQSIIWKINQTWSLTTSFNSFRHSLNQLKKFT